VYSADTSVPWGVSREDLARLPAAWVDPGSSAFASGVLVLVAYRLGKYKQDAHPLSRLVRPAADAIALKLAAKIVARERSRVGGAALLCDKLSDKVKLFVSDHVHAMERSAGGRDR